MWHSQKYIMDIMKLVFMVVMKNKSKSIQKAEDFQKDSISAEDKNNTEKYQFIFTIYDRECI